MFYSLGKITPIDITRRKVEEMGQQSVCLIFPEWNFLIFAHVGLTSLNSMNVPCNAEISKHMEPLVLR